MSSLPSPSSSAAAAILALAPAMEPVVRSILTSTWHAVDQVSPPNIAQPIPATHVLPRQPPPPSLREILAAYKAKGDGDREMLLTMLNAKSAEDQVCFQPKLHHYSMP